MAQLTSTSACAHMRARRAYARSSSHTPLRERSCPLLLPCLQCQHQLPQHLALHLGLPDPARPLYQRLRLLWPACLSSRPAKQRPGALLAQSCTSTAVLQHLLHVHTLQASQQLPNLHSWGNQASANSCPRACRMLLGRLLLSHTRSVTYVSHKFTVPLA